SALLALPGVIEHSTLRSRFGFMAIHGGGLEQMTDVIAERAADAAGASVYAVRHPDHYPHHLSSALYRRQESDRLAEFLDHVEVVVSLHGYGRMGRSTQLLAGGRNRELAEHLARHVDVPGYQVVTDLDAIPRELRGMHPDNPVNLTRGGGTQLELTPRVRGISPRSGLPGDDGLTPATSKLVQGLVATARSWQLTSA
ncbi:MAG TPA: poly-gamma-glutamate hydrolase family protein, partial [Mycobacterium sp.]|nr:poly-gamma-glutamate hydrolase family protein [Mycobacterium sp.]